MQQFRRVVTRYETLAGHHLAMVEGLRVIAVVNHGRLLLRAWTHYRWYAARDAGP